MQFPVALNEAGVWLWNCCRPGSPTLVPGTRSLVVDVSSGPAEGPANGRLDARIESRPAEGMADACVGAASRPHSRIATVGSACRARVSSPRHLSLELHDRRRWREFFAATGTSDQPFVWIDISGNVSSTTGIAESILTPFPAFESLADDLTGGR